MYNCSIVVILDHYISYLVTILLHNCYILFKLGDVRSTMVLAYSCWFKNRALAILFNECKNRVSKQMQNFEENPLKRLKYVTWKWIIKYAVSVIFQLKICVVASYPCGFDVSPLHLYISSSSCNILYSSRSQRLDNFTPIRLKVYVLLL